MAQSLALDRALDFLLEDEGGWSNNAADHGGATMWGITQKVYDSYRQGKGLKAQSVSLVTKPEARDLYLTLYWNTAGCDKLPWPLSYVTFDASVNSGPVRAVKWLQAGLNLPQDGVVGPGTIAAAQLAVNSNLHNTLLAVLDGRVSMLSTLVKSDPSQQIFLLGWWRRTLRVLSRSMS